MRIRLGDQFSTRLPDDDDDDEIKNVDFSP